MGCDPVRPWPGSLFSTFGAACCLALIAPRTGVAQRVPRVSGAAIVTVPAPIPQSILDEAAAGDAEGPGLSKEQIIRNAFLPFPKSLCFPPVCGPSGVVAGTGEGATQIYKLQLLMILS